MTTTNHTDDERGTDGERSTEGAKARGRAVQQATEDRDAAVAGSTAAGGPGAPIPGRGRGGADDARVALIFASRRAFLQKHRPNCVLLAFRAQRATYAEPIGAASWLAALDALDAFGGYALWKHPANLYHVLTIASAAEIQHTRRVLARMIEAGL